MHVGVQVSQLSDVSTLVHFANACGFPCVGHSTACTGEGEQALTLHSCGHCASSDASLITCMHNQSLRYHLVCVVVHLPSLVSHPGQMVSYHRHSTLSIRSQSSMSQHASTESPAVNELVSKTCSCIPSMLVFATQVPLLLELCTHPLFTLKHKI